MKFWSNSDIPSHGTFVPEKRLLAAVLQRAITDFITGDGELKDGARLWLLEDESCSDAPLSFRFICEALDLDLNGLKKAIFMQEAAQATAIKIPDSTKAHIVKASTEKSESSRTTLVGTIAERVVSTATLVSTRRSDGAIDTHNSTRAEIVHGEFIATGHTAQALH